MGGASAFDWQVSAANYHGHLSACFDRSTVTALSAASGKFPATVAFSERIMSPVRLSVVSSVCLSVTFARPTQPVEIFSNVSTHLVPWCGVHVNKVISKR